MLDQHVLLEVPGEEVVLDQHVLLEVPGEEVVLDQHVLDPLLEGYELVGAAGQLPIGAEVEGEQGQGSQLTLHQDPA